ncbi:cytochrome b/b6 domain-containing protein [Qipengyuania sp. RANM35]|uniref:cytochrome b/b6 domain-containing protein n=1 Tax=Qipengyuania sp. RANM35 TaxID=3068635 RepID=UPI0034DB1796
MKRHSLSTRLWHWLNALCVVVLFMSGLTISNAHRHLYWGDWGFDARQAWFDVPRFPDWMTIPGHYSLAVARDWHILMAWPFALGLLFMWVAMLVSRHFVRDIATARSEWRPQAILDDIVQHLKLDFSHAGGKYNFLQKLAYGAVLGIFLPMMIFTGISISPGMGPAFGWLINLFGGRQSARSLHFIFAFATCGFFFVHIALVVLSGPIHQIRDMLTGGRIDEA